MIGPYFIVVPDILHVTTVSVNYFLLYEALAGKDGWAAPRLKDAVLTNTKLCECYFEVPRTVCLACFSACHAILFHKTPFVLSFNFHAACRYDAKDVSKMSTCSWRS